MSASPLSGQTVLVTGGTGFLGTALVPRLQERGARVLVPRRSEYDLTEQDQVRTLLDATRPDIVMHLAAEVGGIGANRDQPGRFFYANAIMGLHLIEAARQVGVGKFVQVGTVCAYPRDTPVPFSEDDLWQGYPEETNAPYGVAKKALLVMLQAYRDQYGFSGIYLLPVNLYGPQDNFDLATSHVIPALIRKFAAAARDGSEFVEVWGTGEASREFLFVEDAARALVLATERYEGREPVNIGAGREVRIRDLVAMIARVTGFSGSVRWDRSKPDGQPRRMLDTRRAAAEFGFAAQTSLEEGLAITAHWWADQPAAPR